MSTRFSQNLLPQLLHNKMTQKTKKLPRILVGCPTFEGKNYCFDDWIANIKSFTYGNYDIFLADNSDSGDNAKMYKEKYKINCKWITNSKNRNSISKRVADGHNEVRKYALENKYDFLLHLESDVFPPKDIINTLLSHNKQMVGATYFLYDDDKRELMVRLLDVDYGEESSMINGENAEILVDGELKSVWSIGLGCNLIHKSVLEKVKFTNAKQGNQIIFSDTTFSMDARKQNIPQYWDTSICCEHRNKNWENYGYEFIKKLA